MNKDHFPWWKDAIYRDGLITFIVVAGTVILVVKLFE